MICQTFVVPPSFAAPLQEQPLWANQTICLLPVHGGYRRSLLLTRGQFLLAASGSFSQAIDYGLYTSRPLSARHQRCYSSLQCFCFIQFITYKGSYNIDRNALSSALCRKIAAFSRIEEIAKKQADPAQRLIYRPKPRGVSTLP